MIKVGDKVKIKRRFYAAQGAFASVAIATAKNKIITVRADVGMGILELYSADIGVFVIHRDHLTFIRRKPSVVRNTERLTRVRRAWNRRRNHPLRAIGALQAMTPISGDIFQWIGEQGVIRGTATKKKRSRSGDYGSPIDSSVISQIEKIRGEKILRRELIQRLVVRIRTYVCCKREQVIFRAPVEAKLAAALVLVKKM